MECHVLDVNLAWDMSPIQFLQNGPGGMLGSMVCDSIIPWDNHPILKVPAVTLSKQIVANRLENLFQGKWRFWNLNIFAGKFSKMLNQCKIDFPICFSKHNVLSQTEAPYKPLLHLRYRRKRLLTLV